MALLIGGPAAAQETPATFEFSFSNPGARSLGIGGAFAGLADDATAAFANPAGLVQLLQPEVSLEGRHWSYSTPYVVGGRYQGEPTGIGLDTTAGVRTDRSQQGMTGLSFLSVVYPRGSWSLALYRHQLAKFRARTETQGLFGLTPDGSATWRSFDRRWSTDLDIVSWGIAGACRVGEKVSLGLALTRFEGLLNAPFDWYLPDDDSPEAIFGHNSYLPDRRLVDGDMAFDGTDWGMSAGFLWRLSGQWNVGGFYRRGPEFNLLFAARAGPAAAALDPSWVPGEELLVVASPMRFPDVYGLGVGFRSRSGRLEVGFEWDRVGYSSIFSSFEPTLVGGADDEADLEVELAADEGDELRLGVEYAFIDTRPVVAVRVGAWLDPDHRFYSTSIDPEHRALFPPGDDELHAAVGVGLAFTSFQVDLGVDFSDFVDTASLSIICSF